jgi:putative hydrolase of the HAD superfamily
VRRRESDPQATGASRPSRSSSEPGPGAEGPNGELPRFRGVLIDLYGTVVSLGKPGARVESLREMARALAVDPESFVRQWSESFDERVRGRLGPLEETIEHLAVRLGHRPSTEQVEQAARIRLDFSRLSLRSDPRVLRALDDLRGAGCRLALVSDTSEETPRLWATSELAPRFEVTVFSCEEQVRKPEPAIYRRALERLRLDPSRCAFVGDGGSHELSGAAAVGLATFRYRFPDEQQDPSDRIDPDDGWSGPTLQDLRELLGRQGMPKPYRRAGTAP